MKILNATFKGRRVNIKHIDEEMVLWFQKESPDQIVAIVDPLTFEHLYAKASELTEVKAFEI